MKEVERTSSSNKSTSLQNDTIAALERWLVREAIQRDIDSFLVSKQRVWDHDTFMKELYRIVLEFPPFVKNHEVDNAVREVLGTLPTVDEAMRLRGSGKGLRRVLAPILSAPIISAARALRGSENDIVDRDTPSEIAARFLAQLNSEPDGLGIFIEELKSAHAISELRPIVRNYLERFREDMTLYLTNIIRDQASFAKLKSLYSKFPKRALLFMLRTNATTSASAMTIRLLFARPFGEWSILQKVVADTLSYNYTCTQVQTIVSELNETVKTYVERFLKTEYVSFIGRMVSQVNPDGSGLSKQEILELTRRALTDYILLESSGEKRLDQAASWSAVRYLEAYSKKTSTEEILDLLGDENLTRGLSKIMLVTHQHLSGNIFAKHSGMEKLARDFFACMDEVLNETNASSAQPPENERKIRIKQAVDRIMSGLLGVIHNVLVADKDLLFHRTAEWAFDLYRLGASFSLPTNDLITRLSQNDPIMFDRVMREAHQVKVREERLQELDGERLPRPRLLNTEKAILPHFTRVLIDTLQKRRLERDGRLAGTCAASVIAKSSHERAIQMHGVRHIEIALLEHEEKVWGHLSSRKYILCGRTRNAALWIRFRADIPPSVHLPAPIVDVRLSDNEQSIIGSIASFHDEWILVPRNLTKNGLYLWFRRAKDENEAMMEIKGIEFLPSKIDERKRMALTQCGYRVIANIGNGHFAEEISVWVLGGIQYQERQL